MSDKKNDVKSTSVSITLNAKQFGVDAFIKLEQTNEFPEYVTDVDALVKREELAQLLTEQALAIAGDTARIVKTYISDNNLTPVAQAAPAVAPAGTGAGAIRAVANGAATGSDWRVAPDSFDAAKQVRFLSTGSFSAEQMKQDAASWLASNGLNPEAFDVWDERRDAENGKAISSVCNIKVKEAFREGLPSDLILTAKGGVKAVARAKFNDNGTLYFHWANKEVDAAIKYGAFNTLKN